MNLICSTSSHVASPVVERNQGFMFSTCLRCGQDMIASDKPTSSGDWKVVPTGFRIKWPEFHTRPELFDLSIRGFFARAHDRVRSHLIFFVARLGLSVMFWSLRDRLRRAAQFRPNLRLFRAPGACNGCEMSYHATANIDQVRSRNFDGYGFEAAPLTIRILVTQAPSLRAVA